MLGEYFGSGTGIHEGLALGFLLGFLGFLGFWVTGLGLRDCHEAIWFLWVCRRHFSL